MGGRICIVTQGVLAMTGYEDASGKVTGLLLDCGDGVCHAMPIIDKEPILSSNNSQQFEGIDLTNYLKKMLTTRNASVARERLTGDEISRAELTRIKESKKPDSSALCRVKLPQDDDFPPSPFTLSNSVTIDIVEEQWRVPEALFNPDLEEKETVNCCCWTKKKTIQQLVMDSITSLPLPAQEAIISKIVLSGGSTMFPLFDERLKLELKKIITSGGGY